MNFVTSFLHILVSQLSKNMQASRCIVVSMLACLNLILQGDDIVQCLITVMACTAIKWLFYQVINNNVYKYGKQNKELVPRL